jgi:4'-phosphopantetheinyl transferase
MLAQGHVHVWEASLEVPVDTLTAYECLLSDDERDRAANFRFSHDSVAFVVARGTLRALLSLYVGVRPQELIFRYGEHGKPGLAHPTAPLIPEFNLSHSDNKAIVAFSATKRVGVDIERIRPIGDMISLMSQCFNQHEIAEVLAAGEAATPVFFRWWSRREAYMKGLGIGLSLSTDDFFISTGSTIRPMSIHNIGMPWESSSWSLRDISIHGFSGTIAVDALDWTMSNFVWHHPSSRDNMRFRSDAKNNPSSDVNCLRRGLVSYDRYDEGL